MRVSSKTDYALRTAIDLALHKDDGVVAAARISERQGIPLKFLEQILMILKGGGIVGSKRGAGGGYYLAGPASEISVASVMRSMEGRLFGPPVSSRRRHELSTTLADGHPFEELWQEVETTVSESLERISIHDMAERMKHQSRVPLDFSI